MVCCLSVPCHYLNQCCTENKLHWNSNETIPFSFIKTHLKCRLWNGSFQPQWILIGMLITASIMQNCQNYHDSEKPDFHDDVIKWKHFSALLAICAGNSPVPGEFPTQRPVTVRAALVFSLICARINGWVNHGEAGDLRRNRAHYDVTVM